MSIRNVFDYYKREDIQKALIAISEKREVVAVYKDGGFSKRPNTLVYPNDIMMQVKSGAVAFHGSIERWTNPMTVGSANYESTRLGWDLILDLDCKKTDHGKIAAKVLIKALSVHGVKNVSIKFTGGTGFHVGVPFEAIPDMVDYNKSSSQYPDLARKIAKYLREYARSELEEELLKKWSPEELAEQAGKKIGEVLTQDGIDPFRIVDIDPILISPRHLFRLPYSLHEKSRLVSLPIKPEEIDDFKAEDADPDNIKVNLGFLDKYKRDEGSMLVMEAVDWWAKEMTKTEKRAVRELTLKSAVPIELAPPCIQNILKGLSDGKKRSLFILINYLSSLKWSWDDIDEFIIKWNQLNKPALRESYVRGQVRWHSRRSKPLPPPNCENLGYYESFGVCKPDSLCGGVKKSIKNPINYAIKKLKKK